MAKIARTPYNAARWLTKEVNTDLAITQKLSGYCLFVTADSTEVNLELNYVSQGSYIKIILTEDSSSQLNISFPAMEGIAIYDQNGVGVLSLGDSDQTTLTLPAGASAGSYVDLICDGDKWYVQAMTHGVTWQQS
jgi:hypothetical protein